MVRIYINYFNDAHIVNNEVLTPIQVGRKLSALKLPMGGDDVGINISDLNPSYCELTGQYWAWKNDNETDYIGFMHYRRFLDFLPEYERDGVTVHGVTVPWFADGFESEFGLDPTNVKAFVQKYDIILPEMFDVRHLGCGSIQQQYAVSPHHHVADFLAARDLVSEMYPDYASYFKKVASGSLFYPTNVFVLRRDIFNEYCEWLFPLLERLEAVIDTSTYNAQEKRVIGYLAERLFTVFILKKIDSEPNLRVRELRRVFVEDTSPRPSAPPLPQTTQPIISIVVATDTNYASHAAALIASILQNTSHKNFVDVIVLGDKLSTQDIFQLKQLFRYRVNSQVSFLDMSRYFLDIPVHAHFSRSTFDRLALPELLYNRDKVIYLDCDMIVLGDLSELYEVELSDDLVAATPDFMMRAMSARGIRSLRETGGVPAKLYLSEYLGMGARGDEYFQAGIILFNLAGLRESGICQAMIRDLEKMRFWYLDQDVLNKHLVGRVRFIDCSWNTLVMDDASKDVLNHADRIAYKNALRNPKVIHYAGHIKPWRSLEGELSSFYWFYLRLTPWYEAVLTGLIGRSASFVQQRHPLTSESKSSILFRLFQKCWKVIPEPLRYRLVPLAIKVRRWVK